jgi:hypothetical protein
MQKRENYIFIVYGVVFATYIAIYFAVFGINPSVNSWTANFILAVTFFSISAYTIETVRLRISQQEANRYTTQEIMMKKKERSVGLIDEYNEKHFGTLDEFLHPMTNRAELLNTINISSQRPDLIDEIKPINACLNFFEKVGLMVNDDLVDFEVLFGYLADTFPKMYRDETVKAIVVLYRRGNRTIFVNYLSLIARFKSRLNEANRDIDN